MTYCTTFYRSLSRCLARQCAARLLRGDLPGGKASRELPGVQGPPVRAAQALRREGLTVLYYSTQHRVVYIMLH